MRSRLAAWVIRAPLALPLLALLGALFSQLGAGPYACLLSGFALLIALWLREWRIALATLLLPAVGYLHLASQLQDEARAREALHDKDFVALRGHVVRESAQSRFLQLEGSSARVEVRGMIDSAHLGDELALRGIVRPISQERLEGCFDRAAWLQSHAVVAQVDVVEMQLLPQGWNWARVLAISAQCRAQLVQCIMPEGREQDAHRQVLCALILGERQLSAPETLQLFQWSGTLHAFAVSGLHVGLIAGILWFVFMRLRMNVALAQWLILLSLALYVFMTGMAVASLRAYLMIFLCLLGMMLRRQINIANLICFAALFILLLAPRQMMQAGFWLSFLVYSGLCLTLAKSKDDRPWFGPDDYLPRQLHSRWDRLSISLELSLRSLLIIALSAFVISLPLNIFFFSSFTPYSVLANICIAPILPLVMAAGLLMLICSSIPILSGLTAALALKSAGLLMGICAFFASLPDSYITSVKPREQHQFVILPLPYGQSATALGNPAVLIHDCNASCVQWTLGPALRGAGFQPALLVESERSTAAAATTQLQQLWPQLQPLNEAKAPLVQHLRLGDMDYRIYPAPLLMQNPRMADRLPIIHWQGPSGSLLYLGDASASTYEYWKAQGAALRAKTIILGYNDKQPFLDEEELQVLGCEELILLPSVPATQAWPDLPAGLHIRRVIQGSPFHGELIP